MPLSSSSAVVRSTLDEVDEVRLETDRVLDTLRSLRA